MQSLQNCGIVDWATFRGGRIERLVHTSILPPLEFSNLEQCIDYIKGKFIKKIKKDVKQSVGILEIIHIHLWSVSCDICGWL